MTASHLCEYEQWPASSGRKPSPQVLALLAHVYDTTIHHLLDLDDWEHLAPADRLLLDKRPDNPTAGGHDDHAGSGRDRAAVRRRPAGGHGPAPTAGVATRAGSGSPDEERGPLARAGRDGRLDPDDEERLALAVRRPSRVDARVVASLATILAEHRTTEDVVGSARLLTPVCGQLAEIERLVADVRGQVRGPLLDVAAQWAEFAGWLHLNTERYEQARAWLDRAAEWSAETGDITMGATILSFKGHLAFQRGHLAAAIGLTQAATRDRRVWVGQRAYDAHQEARCHAVAGDVVAAAAKLGEAADLTAATAEDTGGVPPWLYYYTAPFYVLERGWVHRHLGRSDPAHNERAIASLTAGLGGLGTSRDSEWAAEYTCHLAVAYFQAGAPDLACAAAAEAAAVAHATGSVRLRAIVRRLHARLAERWPNHPAVADLAEILYI
jgi:hypothetical protein